MKKKLSIRAMKQFFKLTVFILFLITILVVFLKTESHEVFLESLESKNQFGEPVFNRIKLMSTNERDIWMMNQSHHGKNTPDENWDRLAIVVDKTTQPFTARYYQLPAGPLIWSENPVTKPFRVSCFMCHNNGPRVIRPNNQSATHPINSIETIQIFFLNFKIRSYPRILPDATHLGKTDSVGAPFRWTGNYENETLEVKACTKCHNEIGPRARGKLTRQQTPTIRFMVESGFMPPHDSQLNKNEQKQIMRFMQGF